MLRFGERRRSLLVLDDKREHECCALSALCLLVVCLGATGVYTYFVLTQRFRITGDVGVTGDPGSDGLLGPTGAAGESGIVGVNGTTGKTGPTGEQGLIGSQGIRGWNCWETNETRISGNVSMCIGPEGHVGVQGPTGPTGNAGDIGSEGGLRAWDRLFSGNCSAGNDANGDGVCNITDAAGTPCDPAYNISQCQGPVGYTGQQGILGPIGPTGPSNSTPGPTGPTGCPCWDIGCTGTLSLSDIIAYNVNGDGSLDVNDCIGPVGAVGGKGVQGLPGNSTNISGERIDNYTARVTPHDPSVYTAAITSGVSYTSSPSRTVNFVTDYFYQFFGANNDTYKLWFDMNASIPVTTNSVEYFCGDLKEFTDPGYECNIWLACFRTNADGNSAARLDTLWQQLLGLQPYAQGLKPRPAVWDCQIYFGPTTGPMFRAIATGEPDQFSTMQYPAGAPNVCAITTHTYPFSLYNSILTNGGRLRYTCTITAVRIY